MYGNYFNQATPVERIDRQIEELQRMREQYKQPVQPINNIINTQPSNCYELKQLKDGEDVEDIYISNKTIFKNNNQMIIKDLDGNIEKYEIKKTYPLDEKDTLINELQEKIKMLEGAKENESKSSEPINAE